MRMSGLLVGRPYEPVTAMTDSHDRLAVGVNFGTKLAERHLFVSSSYLWRAQRQAAGRSIAGKTMARHVQQINTCRLVLPVRQQLLSFNHSGAPEPQSQRRRRPPPPPPPLRRGVSGCRWRTWVTREITLLPLITSRREWSLPARARDCGCNWTARWAGGARALHRRRLTPGSMSLSVTVVVPLLLLLLPLFEVILETLNRLKHNVMAISWWWVEFKLNRIKCLATTLGGITMDKVSAIRLVFRRQCYILCFKSTKCNQHLT